MESFGEHVDGALTQFECLSTYGNGGCEALVEFGYGHANYGSYFFTSIAIFFRECRFGEGEKLGECKTRLSQYIELFPNASPARTAT
jgi:hypothetical protein